MLNENLEKYLVAVGLSYLWQYLAYFLRETKRSHREKLMPNRWSILKKIIAKATLNVLFHF
jgi:hypothetical protein